MGSAQQQNKNDEWNRNTDEPEKNGHVISFRIAISIQLSVTGLGSPGAIAEATALGGGQAGAEGTD